MRVGERLQALRKRTGLSRQAFARQLGYRSASGYYRYEDPDLHPHDSLPAPLVERLRAIVGQGMPPITPEDIEGLRRRSVGNDVADPKANARAAYARLGKALADGRIEAAAAYCQVLAGEIALLRLRGGD
ncbi:helix-turn-helix domain-containing protein [Niveispirillum fermenti]|uniref:helix-turn-helix domain-containing protein n=1 Tax=Niveispirillum fermenti TaxID=1233113 RepID=UPI003A87FBE9